MPFPAVDGNRSPALQAVLELAAAVRNGSTATSGRHCRRRAGRLRTAARPTRPKDPRRGGAQRPRRPGWRGGPAPLQGILGRRAGRAGRPGCAGVHRRLARPQAGAPRARRRPPARAARYAGCNRRHVPMFSAVPARRGASASAREQEGAFSAEMARSPRPALSARRAACAAAGTVTRTMSGCVASTMSPGSAWRPGRTGRRTPPGGHRPGRRPRPARDPAPPGTRPRGREGEASRDGPAPHGRSCPPSGRSRGSRPATPPALAPPPGRSSRPPPDLQPPGARGAPGRARAGTRHGPGDGIRRRAGQAGPPDTPPVSPGASPGAAIQPWWRPIQ